jgi:hypothetical protein
MTGKREGLGRLIPLHEHHLRARHHDVAHLHVRHRQHALQHDQRIAVEQAPLAGLAQVLDEPRQAARLAGHGLGDALQPAAGTAMGLLRHAVRIPDHA